MAQLRAAEPPARVPITRIVEMARQVLEIQFDPEETRQIHEAQHLANEHFAAAHERLERLLQTAEEFQRQALQTRNPNLDRSWLSPRRWFAEFRARLLRQQESFNAQLARVIGLLADAETLRHQQAALGRLVASTNCLVRRLSDLDRLATERSRALADLFGLALERMAAAQSAPAPCELPVMSSEERERLRALVASVAEASAHTAALRAEVSRHVAALSARVEQAERAHADLVQTVQAIADRTARPAAEAPIPARPASPQPVAMTGGLPKGMPVPPLNFEAFEAATRGDEQRIAREQRAYVAWFADAPGRVLDAGCGRGEFLGLLREAGIAAYGIDSDPQMVAHCCAKGLDVMEAALFEHLDGLPDASLGGVFLGQVVEHLQQKALLALPALLWRKIAPGGRVAIETINPMCLTTFSGAMYADPTHRRPVHPKALEFLLGSAGFGDIEIVFNAPVPPDEALQPLAETAPLEPVLKDLVVQANRNIERLNALLYSYANYAIAARKPV